MLISVIIPVFNAATTLVEALESVRNQTYKGDFEVIVINDGSTDESSTVLLQYQKEHPEMKLQILHQENKGVSAARNLGLRKAQGDFLALLDADDVWLPQKIEKQMTFLTNQDLKIDFLGTARNNKKLLFPYIPKKNNLAEVTFRKLLFRNEITVPSVVFKKEILQSVGFFDEKRYHAEDVDYWLRISGHHKMYLLGESLLIAGGGKRTFGVSGLSSNLKKMHQGFLQNLKKMWQHKRISLPEYVFYFLFYKFKYLVLLLRNAYYKANEKSITR